MKKSILIISIITTANGNPFYQTETISNPIISGKAIITAPAVKETFVYDVLT